MKRIGLIFLSCEEISSSELKIFMTQVPLESFHNQPFTTVLSSLGIDLHIPSPPPSSPSIDMPSTSSSKETIQTVPSAPTTTSWLIRPQNWHLLGPNGHNENIEMIEISLQYLLHYLENIESIYEYLFVGGISSGGELCLHLLRKFFTFSHKILGIFTIGSYLIESTILSTKNGKPIEENSPSLLMMHGQEDELVPIDWGRFTASNLSIYSSHLDLQFLEFPECGHEIHEEQLHALLDWMEDRINYKLQPQQTTDNSISLTNEANSNDDDNDEIDEIREHELQEQYKKLTESRVKFQALKDETEANIDPVKTDTTTSNTKYHLEHLPTISSYTYRVFYPTEPEMISALVGRPVLANGGMFDITSSSNGRGVECIFQSIDPDRTANAIGERLASRILASREGSTVGPEVCIIS